MSKIPRMLTVKQTAEETGLPERFVRRLCASGEIVTVKSGCKYLINLDRLIDFLNGQGKGEDTEPKQYGAIRRVG